MLSKYEMTPCKSALVDLRKEIHPCFISYLQHCISSIILIMCLNAILENEGEWPLNFVIFYVVLLKSLT